MAGFIFRARRQFTIQELTSLEGVYVEDLDPPSQVVGVGTGTICLIGEFEDGPVNALTEILNGDITAQFGGFGFSYANIPANNPCARKRGGELWNGNGFLYSRYIRGNRFMVVRVDTSVGKVAFSPRALLKGGAGPFLVNVGDQLSITTSTGGPSPSTAIAAAQASAVGSSAITATGFLGGEQISIGLDQNSAPIVVTFGAGDQTAAAVVTRINNAVGAVVASQAAGVVTINGLVKGTSGRLGLGELSTGALAALKLVAGSNSGTGNVGNVLAVSAAELVALINGTAALTTIGAKALIAQDGTLALYDNAAASGTVTVAAGTLAQALKLPQGAAAVAGQGNGGVIPAGTRVRTAGGLEWVTQSAFTVPAGTSQAPQTGPFLIAVRPSFDDGTQLGTAASTVTVLADQPAFGAFSVNNPQALSAALTEGQVDVAYLNAIAQTVDSSGIARDINYVYSARKSLAVDTAGVQNAEDASNNGCAGRVFIRSASLGVTEAQALSDKAALTGTDRQFYTWPGWQVVIPEILTRGAAGGQGFTDTGIVTLRGAGPLAKICALLNPEENPGQATQLIENFFATEVLPQPLQASDYRALKAAGICAPRRDSTAGSIYQSGVTADVTTPSRQTCARRKMADFCEDSIARLCVKYSKKLGSDARKDALLGEIDSFLSPLLEAERIDSYLIDTSANTDASEALGIYTVIAKVRTLASLDAIEIRAVIGNGVVTVSENDAQQAA